MINSELSLQQQQTLKDIIEKFQPNASVSIGRTTEAQHRIITGDTLPIKLHAYSCQQVYEERFRIEIQYLLDQKLIEPSASPRAALMFFVPKKGTDELRLVVNYKHLNDVTESDPYQMSRMELLREKMAKAKIFSTIDLKKGYYPVLMDERDKHKTTFVTEFGKYQFVVMPFGLKNTPSTFQHMMGQHPQ